MFSKLLKGTLVSTILAASAVFLCSCNLLGEKLIDINQTFEDKNITEINADIEWGELKIISSEDTYFTVDAKKVPESFSAEVSNNKFVIKTNSKSKSMFKIKNGSDTSNITIKVPKKIYDKLELKLDAGETTLKDLSTSKLTVTCGAGEVNITGVETTKMTELKGGAGEINISNSVFGGLDADLGVGDFKFSGTINGDINVECGIGDANIDLKNPESDFKGANSQYSIDIKKGLGDSSISYDN